VEAQFTDWYQVREGVVSGEVHYKAILDAARVRAASRMDAELVWLRQQPS
jgi:hypothetical protein